MEDMERYGDYNETEDDAPRRRGGFLRVLQILVALVCLATAGVIGYRLFLFDYYPAEMKQPIFTERLTAYYREVGEDALGIRTQKLRFPYDDNDKGNFFCDHLYVIPGAGELQISLRYNESALATIASHYGFESLTPSDDLFSFRITDNVGRDYGTPVYQATDAYAMYHYYKLAFDGIEFDNPSDGAEAPAWIRLEIFVKGAPDDKAFSYVAIYENNEDYAKFSDYKPSRKELPS